METNKYILIEEYPGSPKIGTVTEEFCNFVGDKNPRKYKIEDCIFINAEHIENQPKFWKKFIQPDFQVIEIISPDGYIAKGKEVIYGYAYGAYPEYKIHSIKRMSDGEIFTVGDTIVSTFKSNSVIKELKIFNDSLKINTLNGYISMPIKGSLIFKSLVKLKQPLFKTEDGVDVFEGDTFAHTSGTTEPKVLVATKKHLNYSLPMDKLFSTKEKAEYYVKMNKREFSRNQIIALLDKLCLGNAIVDFFINELDKK